MLRAAKGAVRRVVAGLARSVARMLILARPGRVVLDAIVETVRSSVLHVSHGGVHLTFAAPNELNRWRINTFETKEPETLDWLDGVPRGAVLWDVGANVGLYSCYAAARGCRVFAFEPSVFNLELLAQNVHLNALTERVVIIPLPLSDELKLSSMQLTSVDWGGALSTFGEDFGWDGEAIRQVFEFRTVGVSMTHAAQALAIPTPDYIKLDVDGLEHFILRGGTEVLARADSVLLEVNDDFVEQAEQCDRLLRRSGLVRQAKIHSELVATSASAFANTFNQVWTRPGHSIPESASRP